STDGRVYAVGAKSGEIRWVHSTGDWVYGSPAVGDQKVFIGSYDGTVYALAAKTGDERWNFDAGDRVAGSATIIDDVVYFSTLGTETFGLALSNGSVKWQTDDGRLGGVVTDGAWVYLTGDRTLYAFDPTPDPPTAVNGATTIADTPDASTGNG
ncbi:MAG: PQQ-binding-like beta-propeller repeat protein, partial [Thermoleophilia bacterium]|nr:PQQ-binding-like beta-propeller repeat protein [Thermoleophilia bacterium]